MRAWAVLMGLGALGGVARAQSEPAFRVHVLASTEGAYLTLPTEPAASGVGTVVYYGERKDGRVGVYTSTGGQSQPVAQVGETLDYDGIPVQITALGRYPSVNAGQEVVFLAEFDEDAALVARAGAFGPVQFVADSGEAFREFGGRFDQNVDGHVLFTATLDPPGHPDRADTLPSPDLQDGDDPDELPPAVRMTRDGQKPKHDNGVFLDTSVNLIVVGGTHSDFLDVEDGVAINDGGLVAYRAWFRGGRLGLVLQGPDVFPQTLVRTGVVFDRIGLPAMNNRAEVVYVAVGMDGTEMICRSRRGSSAPERVVTSGSALQGFAPTVAIDDRGRILYVAHTAEGDRLIEHDDGRGPRVLLAAGTAVDGHKVERITVGPRAYSGWGRIAVRAVLEGPVEAILLLYTEV